MPLYYTQPYDVTIDSGSLPLPVTGTISVSGTQTVTGTVGISGPVAISGVVQVSGVESVTVSNFPAGFNANITASVPLTASISGVVTVSQSNGWIVTEKRASQSVLTTASFTNSTSVVLPANPNRINATIFNPATPVAYLALAATASLIYYTAQVGSGGYFELPENYTGPVSAIATVAGPGTLRVTEMTP